MYILRLAAAPRPGSVHWRASVPDSLAAPAPTPADPWVAPLDPPYESTAYTPSPRAVSDPLTLTPRLPPPVVALRPPPCRRLPRPADSPPTHPLLGRPTAQRIGLNCYRVERPDQPRPSASAPVRLDRKRWAQAVPAPRPRRLGPGAAPLPARRQPSHSQASRDRDPAQHQARPHSGAGVCGPGAAPHGPWRGAAGCRRRRRRRQVVSIAVPERRGGAGREASASGRCEVVLLTPRSAGACHREGVSPDDLRMHDVD